VKKALAEALKDLDVNNDSRDEDWNYNQNLVYHDCLEFVFPFGDESEKFWLNTLAQHFNFFLVDIFSLKNRDVVIIWGCHRKRFGHYTITKYGTRSARSDYLKPTRVPNATTG